MTWNHTFDEVDVVAETCPPEDVINNSKVTAIELAKDNGDSDDRGDIWNEKNCSEEGLSPKSGVAQYVS